MFDRVGDLGGTTHLQELVAHQGRMIPSTVRADGTHTQLLAEVPEYTELMAAFEHDRAQLDEEPSPDEVAG